MFEFLRGLLSGVMTFYAWTIGAGIVALLLITLGQGAMDLIRDWTGHGLTARARSFRRGT
jgi:hypothetical protein